MAKFDVDSFFEKEEGVDYSETASEAKIDLTEEENEGVVVVDWKQPLFSSLHNPNHKIFVLETQQGYDENDQGHGSIGDATMDHVTNMSHRLPEMQAFFRMPNGNLFRTVPNVQPMDEDGARYNKRQMLEVMTSTDSKVTSEDKENVIEFLQEEIAERKLTREDKQDAMDQTVIPYEQWEAMPQMTRDWDVPPTQPPIFVYAGNTSQPFYDYLPEDHPDRRLITQFILMVNAVDWDDFDEWNVDYFKEWLFGEKKGKNRRTFAVGTTPIHLADFCEEVAKPNGFIHPDDLMKEALGKIEKDWTTAVYTKVVNDFEQTPISKDLRRLRDSLNEGHDKGKLVWAEIGQYGKNLYKRYGSTITTPHWGKYRQLKNDLAPVVMVNKVDINRVSYRELKKMMSKSEADKIYFNRPFMNLHDLMKKKAISLSSIGYTKNNVVFVTQIKSAAKKAMELRVPSMLGKLAQQIITTQQNKPEIMSEEEWSAVWQTYRIAKTEVKTHLGLSS